VKKVSCIGTLYLQPPLQLSCCHLEGCVGCAPDAAALWVLLALVVEYVVHAILMISVKFAKVVVPVEFVVAVAVIAAAVVAAAVLFVAVFFVAVIVNAVVFVAVISLL